MQEPTIPDSKSSQEKENNNILRLYNQFPNRYKDGFLQMLEDLLRIAQMGFCQIWINPITKPGTAFKSNGKDQKSMYATGHTEFFNDKFFPEIDDHVDREKLLKEYVAIARILGLTPIFDLVLNHVGIGSELEEKCLMLEFLDDKIKDPETKSKKKSESWDDTIPFNYETKQMQEKIIEKIWEPFIKKYIQKYGFLGARIDAITNIDEGFQREIYTIIQKYALEKAIILGELMVGKPQNYIERLKDKGFTHILSPGSLYRNVLEYKADLIYDNSHEKKCYYLEQAWDLQEIAFSVSMSGNHDAGPSYPRVYFMKKGKKDKDLGNAMKGNSKKPEITVYNPEDRPEIRERFLRVAMTCNGGWYLLAGDEFNALTWPTVFGNYEKSEYEDWHSYQDSEQNFSKYISLLNYILKELPESEKPEGNHRDYAHHIKIIINKITVNIVRRYSKKEKKFYLICESNEKIKEEDLLNALKEKIDGQELCQTNSNIYFINNDILLYSENRKNFENIDVVFLSRRQQILAFYHMARAMLIINNRENAMTYFKCVIKMLPREEEIENLDSELLCALLESNFFVKEYLNSNYQKIHEFLMKKCEEDIILLCRVGNIYFEYEQMDESNEVCLKLFEMIKNEVPIYPSEYYFQVAMILYKNNMVEQSEKCCNLAIERNRNDILVFYEASKNLFNINPEKFKWHFIRFLNDLKEMYPKRIECFSECIPTLLSCGLQENIEIFYISVIEKDKKNQFLYYELGKFYFEILKNREKALQCFRIVMELLLDKKRPRALFSLANKLYKISMETGETDKNFMQLSLKCYEAALSIDSGNFKEWYKFARNCHEIQNNELLEKAALGFIAVFEKAPEDLRKKNSSMLGNLKDILNNAKLEETRCKCEKILSKYNVGRGASRGRGEDRGRGAGRGRGEDRGRGAGRGRGEDRGRGAGSGRGKGDESPESQFAPKK